MLGRRDNKNPLDELDMKNVIAVVCYDRIEYWKSRKLALGFYTDGANECDGNESSRYANIAMDLLAGLTICQDGQSKDIVTLMSEGRFLKFPNGTYVRDLNGQIEFPVL